MKTGHSGGVRGTHRSRNGLWFLLLLLVLILGYNFASSFNPSLALFANDGPLGAQISEIYKMPGAFHSIWSNLYWVGSYGGNYAPNVTGLLLWVLGPLAFNKFYVPTSLLLLGLSAAFFFRQLGFKPAICILAGLAAALNSNFFSNACWGLSSRALSLAATFLALTAVHSSFSGRAVVRTILAGLAIGLSISEGGDNGAIFSLFVAAFAAFSAWHQQGSVGARIAQGGGRVALMAAFAAILAAQTLNVFVGTAVKGIVGVEQSSMSPERKWTWATQWSLPKAETLRIIIPGLFGYRLDTPGGGNYWGGVGQEPGWDVNHDDPAWAREHPGALPCHSGAGEYAGVLVVLVALWAGAHSLVSNGGSFSLRERRAIWFWSSAALIALVLSWGWHAPFYRLVYSLPYFSTIRNPMKFMHPFHMALLVLFAYGLQGLRRRYLEPMPAMPNRANPPGAAVFDRQWFVGSIIAVALSVIGWLIYSSSRAGVARHVAKLGFDADQAAQVARFSSAEAGWSALFLILSAGVVWMITQGWFKGIRARWAGLALGIVLVADLTRANAPWINYYDYKEKYASNGVLELLSLRPHKHRVAMPPLQWDGNYSVFQQVYAVEWLQHQFPFYNIQSLDQPQEPRLPADKAAYREALGTNIVRLWELTNTRYLCGMAGNFAEGLNQQLDQRLHRFKQHTRFTLFQNPTSRVIGARVDESGPFALIEFTGALPRAKLYSRWRVSTNDAFTLATLADPGFDPHETVLVSESVTASPASVTNQAPGSVEFASYAPKRVELKADTATPSILLLNEKLAPGWTVTVDGHAAPILRCNFFMRGVHLAAGHHTVVFSFRPRSTFLHISIAVTGFGLLLCGYLAVSRTRDVEPSCEVSSSAGTERSGEHNR